MRTLFLLFFFILSTALFAQGSSNPQQTIIDFFEAFHRQDTIALRSLAHTDIVMQSIGTSETGEAVLNKSPFSNFLKSIASIPSDRNFEERILGYEVREDEMMANVWTPYQFYINGTLSHCGVNSFQLIKTGNAWKIFFIVDTRFRNGCE